MTNLKVLAVVLLTLLAYTSLANMIPQVESEVPRELSFAEGATPEQIEQIVRPVASAVWTQGKRFGTIGCTFGGRRHEITPHRAEASENDSRKPEVALGDDIHGTFFGGTSTLSPVLGLRPLRGSRRRRRKLPNPRSSIFSPRCSASMMLLNTVSTMTSECFFVRSDTRETSSTSSALVMLPAPLPLPATTIGTEARSRSAISAAAAETAAPSATGDGTAGATITSGTSRVADIERKPS